MSQLAPTRHAPEHRSTAPRDGGQPSFVLMLAVAAAGALLGTALMLPGNQDGEALTKGGFPPGMRARLTLTPWAVDAGDAVTVTGRRFDRGQRGSVAVRGGVTDPVAFTANKRGRFSVTLPVAPAEPSGVHTIVAIDAESTTVVATAELSVVEAGAVPAPTPTPAGPITDPTAAPTDASPDGTPMPDGTAKPSPSPTMTPNPTPEPTPAPTPTPPSDSPALRWGLIGNDGRHLAEERAAGINTKLLELGWSSYEPSQGAYSANYIAAKKAELAALRNAGFDVILSFGVQYSPKWLLELPDSRYVNQYGDAYTDGSLGSGQANVIWNPTIRAHMATYMARVFADLGTNFDAVRIGGGRYGELGYPVTTWNGRSNTYWAFDDNAAKSNPVPGWKPGMASPNGEAGRFLEWYLDRLDAYQGWQINQVRKHYGGRIMALYPSFGIRPGQAAKAIDVNLNGSTSAEINGEVPRGYDFARFVGSINDSRVLVTTTWLNCEFGDDSSSDPARGTPVKYLAWLAAKQGLKTYGENTGRDGMADLRFTNAQAKRYDLVGFLWFNESELFSGQYATLDQYASVIADGP